MNTGWTGGAYGAGSRIKLAYTRAMIHAAFDGKLNDIAYEEESVFGLSIPTECPGVPTELLNPRKTWEDESAYDTAAAKLKEMIDSSSKHFELV